MWDTTWSANKTAEHRYSDAGNHTVRLAIKDSRGEVRSSTQLVQVTKAESESTERLIQGGVIVVAVAVVAALALHFIRRKTKESPPVT